MLSRLILANSQPGVYSVSSYHPNRGQESEHRLTFS